MDIIDLANDIIRALKNYIHGSISDIRLIIEIEKEKYLIRTYKKRQEDLYRQMGKMLAAQYQKGDGKITQMHMELLTLSEILESIIFEKEQKIREILKSKK